MSSVAQSIDIDVLKKAWRHICCARAMAKLFEEKKEICATYVHATSRGHEAFQLAAAYHLKPQDFAFPYYRDDAMLLGLGFSPYDLILQLLAKKTDYFSSGRTYYSHPSSKKEGIPKIPHQSSATGMQAIPATGAAQGLQYLEQQGLSEHKDALSLCSLGDGSVTEGEVSEAMQMAVLHQYPIIFFIQDNEWDISAHSRENRAMDADYFAKGFKGMSVVSIDGTDFTNCYESLEKVFTEVRKERKPYLVHAKVPLLNHHTSGVRMEWYRPEDDLDEHWARDPFPILKAQLSEAGMSEEEISQIEEDAQQTVAGDFERAMAEPDPTADDLFDHIFAPTPITEEKGIRKPEKGEKVVMVDAALHAVDEVMKKQPESLLYGQDVGGELGGVFREAALLAKKYGDQRVFNTPIQEAYIIGSTVGMSAAGCKPIVEVQFADYIWPGLNQLFTEASRSYYLSNGKFPVSAVIRVPIGAYGGGGPYHSSSVESVLMQIKGIKVVYPSNAADMKGLFKAAFYDPNPVVMLEHKGLYWSKVPGTLSAKTIEPDEDYIIPLGKANIALEAVDDAIKNGESLVVVTYGMGVHWAKNAAKQFSGQIEVLDLRCLNPLDDEMIEQRIKIHNKCIVLTEETLKHSFAEALAGRIASNCFEQLDAPLKIIGAKNTPAVPLNLELEKAMLPNQEIVAKAMEELLNY